MATRWGATSSTATSGSAMTTDTYCARGTISEAGTLTKVGFYWDGYYGSQPHNFRMAVYTGDGHTTMAASNVSKIWDSGDIGINSDTQPAWVEVDATTTGTGTKTFPAGQLWIVWKSNDDCRIAKRYVPDAAQGNLDSYCEIAYRLEQGSNNNYRDSAYEFPSTYTGTPVQSSATDTVYKMFLEYDAQSSIVITPNVGSLALTGVAPTLEIKTETIIQPSSGSLGLTGAAPTVAVRASITTLVGALAFTAYPAAAIVNDFRTPSVATLDIRGFAPLVIQNAPNAIIPNPGAMGITAYAPSIKQGNITYPSVASLAFTLYAPTVSLSPAPNIVPLVGALGFTGYIPSVVRLGQTVYPQAGSLNFTGNQPEQTLQVNPPFAGGLTLAGYAPTASISGNVTVSPNVGAVNFSGLTPNVNQTVQPFPLVGAIALTAYAPTLAWTDHHYRTPGVARLNWSGTQAGVLSGDNAYRTPDVGAVAFTAYAPTLVISDNKIPAPLVGSLALTGVAPTVSRTLNVVISPMTGVLLIKGKQSDGGGTTEVIIDMPLESDDMWVVTDGDM